MYIQCEKDIWEARHDIRKHIAIWSTNRLYKQMYRVNEHKKFGIQALYDFMNIRKCRLNNTFLLKDKNGKPMCEQDDIQTALFNQVDSIFQNKIWNQANDYMNQPSLKIDRNSQDFLIEDITVLKR